jgi:hypothetical protein
MTPSELARMFIRKGIQDEGASIAFLKNKLTLYPGCSLLQNIGNDQSGTHCSSETVQPEICARKLKVEKIPLTICYDASRMISLHLREISGGNEGIIKRLKNLLWK